MPIPKDLQDDADKDAVFVADADDDEDPTGDQPEEKMFSQKELDRIVAKRLKRSEDILTKKFSDYDQRVADSDAYRKLQDEKSTDSQRWEREREAFQKALQEKDEKLNKLERASLIADLATDKGLPKSFWKRVQGDTEEEIAEDMDSMIKDLDINPKDESKDTSTRVTRKRNSVYGGGGEHEDPEPDIDSIVSRIPRGPQIRIDKPRSK